MTPTVELIFLLHCRRMESVQLAKKPVEIGSPFLLAVKCQSRLTKRPVTADNVLHVTPFSAVIIVVFGDTGPSGYWTVIVNTRNTQLLCGSTCLTASNTVT